MDGQRKAAAFAVFNQLRLQGKLCDAVIRVENVDFDAHRVVLCSCSPYFRALFDPQWTNPEDKVYDIPSLSSKMMRLILEYAYTHSVPVTEDNVEELCAVADQFAVKGIIDACCTFQEKHLRSDNCIGIWKFADAYYCPELKRRAFLFILHRFEEVVASEEFLQLTAEQLAAIIGRDDLNAKQEKTVFEAVVRWISHSPEDRQRHVALLVSKFRLTIMNTDYFINDVKYHALVKDNPECQSIINNTFMAMYNLLNNRDPSLGGHTPLFGQRLPYAVLLAIGGWSGGGPTNGIEAYDPRADRWVNVTTNEERPRAYHGATFLDGMVYCVGGFDSIEYFSSVRRFDPRTYTWHEAAPMHSCRCYVSVVALNGCIYAMGGYDGHGRLNTAERYDPRTNQWTRLPHMHEQRSDASAAALRGKVFICGGFNGNECLATAECYDPDTNQWTLIAPMRSRRSGVGVVAYRGNIYAVGGFDGTSRLQSVEAYNPVINSWHNMPSMLTPRSNFGIEVVDDLLFAVGGFNGFTTTFNVECYDGDNGEWCEAHSMDIFRSAVSCCVVHGLPNIAEYAAPRAALLLPPAAEGDSEGSIESL